MKRIPAKRAPQPAKRRVNLSIRRELVDEAKHQKLNLSQVAEEAVEAVLRQHRMERWREENREAIEAYNRRVQKNGLWHKGLTPWY